jgi:hypothetical protein
MVIQDPEVFQFLTGFTSVRWEAFNVVEDWLLTT